MNYLFKEMAVSNYQIAPICSCARTNLHKVVIATVPNVPVFTSNTDCDLGETEVMIYAWKGEKLLGRWYAGRY